MAQKIEGTERSPSGQMGSMPLERELKELRRQHQFILNAVGEGVYGLDQDGNVTFVNPAAAAMIDWPIEELIGASMHRVLHHSHEGGATYPRHECPIYAALKDGAIHRVTTEVFWRKDGTSFPVEYISMPMREENGAIIGAVVTFRDITQQRWAEQILARANEELELKVQRRTQKLQEANQQLRELNTMRSRFIAMVCHEFRNPLNNIVLSVSSIQRYDRHLSPEEKQDYLLNIHKSVERMTQIIDDILVIGKIEAKVLEVNPQHLDLVELCRSIVGEYVLDYPDHRILFGCRHRRLMVNVDERLWRSIIHNLLGNALRYSPPGQAVHLNLNKRGHLLTLKVIDQGMGIPKEDQKQLFEPFHRGSNVINIPGTGLGLTIVQQYLNLLHGEIEVSSKVNQGTTFTLKIPLD